MVAYVFVCADVKRVICRKTDAPNIKRNSLLLVMLLCDNE